MYLNYDHSFSFIKAVRGAHAEIIDYLLKAGSDIHSHGWLGQSAVQTASKFFKFIDTNHSNIYFIIVVTGDQATADTLLTREMIIGCSCRESHHHEREHLRQASVSIDE